MGNCVNRIERKSMLYQTKVEYGDYTMNHVQGCSHGCMYPCYAYLMAKRFGRVRTYEEWCEPVLVANTLELLDKEIPKMKGKIKHVQLVKYPTTWVLMLQYISLSIQQLHLNL